MKDVEKRDMFEIEIDYSIIKSLAELYKCLRNSGIRMKSMTEEEHVNFTKLDEMIKLSAEFIETAEKSGILNLFQDTYMRDKIKPIDYPEGTLKCIGAHFYSGENRWSALKQYNPNTYDVSKSIVIDQLKHMIMKVYIWQLKNYDKLTIEVKKKAKRIPNILFKIFGNKMDKAQKTIEHYNNSIKSTHTIIQQRINSYHSRINTELEKWSDYRLINAYFDRMTNKLSYNCQICESEASYALKHNIMQIDEEIHFKDSWLLAKNDFDELMGDRSVDDIKSLIYDKLDGLRTELTGKISMNKDITESLKNSECELKEVYGLVAQKGVLLLDYLDSYGFELDEEEVDVGILSFKDILRLSGVEEIQIEVGDRLDLEACTTQEVVYTEDIEKEYLIKEVFRKGIKIGDHIYRKAIVSVYRLNLV